MGTMHLSEQTHDDSDSRVVPALETAGAPVDEIEVVTLAMVEAGAVHLFRYHPDRGVSAEETVGRIFLAMLRARRDRL